MKKFRDLNTYYKLLLLTLSTSVLFLLLYVILHLYTSKKETQLYETTSKQYQKEIVSLLNLHCKTPMSVITDVTFWDELYFFTKTKDKQWYDLYIAGEFASYDVDYIGIYDIKNQLINYSSKSEIKTKDFIPKSVFKKLYESKLMHFYLKIPEGYVEVFAATIHTSNDPKKILSLPSGYFFMAKRLNQDYLNHLNEISYSRVNLIPIDTKIETPDAVLESKIVLKDNEDKAVVNLVFNRDFDFNFKNTKEILVLLIVFSFLNIFIYLYFSRKWIFAPLRSITTILETGDKNEIKELKKESGEFAYFGHLFEENNYQREQLVLAKLKAEESDKLKSSFLANLSHEIRTPMNAIIGFSDLLEDETLNESDKNDYLKIIKNCGINLVSIIEDLIEMSKIDSKQITPNLRGVNLEVCLKELYDTLRVTLPDNKDVKLLFVDNQVLATNFIITDEIKLKQVIVNLISNAIRYTDKGEIIFTYAIDRENQKIEFIVQDTGIGIDEENLKVIFDRFRRVEQDFKMDQGGLGLGLAISKAYVEILGGTINVQSQIGVGSTFTFTIPLLYETKVPVQKQEQAFKFETKPNNKLVLIAEDDNINFLLLKKILEIKNYKVIRAKNGQEAIDICKENQDIELVFMDVKMPILSGIEAFKVIHSIRPALPIVVQTACAAEEEYEKLIQIGFSSYLSKPLDKEKVFKIIETIFDSKDISLPSV